MPDLIVSAILNTLTYADLFDYALTPAEVHRYLIGVRTSREKIERALYDLSRLDGGLAHVDGFVALPRRQSAVASRLRWREHARGLWKRAEFYARILAHFPFVLMVAVSGGLAMDNARDNDIDLLIITAQGRLWLTRALAVSLVRFARLRGAHLCPNFLLTENALALAEQNLYTAREVNQLVPLYGIAVFQKLRQQNSWTKTFLPNADGLNARRNEIQTGRIGGLCKRFAERMLGGRIGNAIERWEMSRKIAKLSAQIPKDADQVVFSADACNGFFSGHQRRVLNEYYERTKNYCLPIVAEQMSLINDESQMVI